MADFFVCKNNISLTIIEPVKASNCELIWEKGHFVSAIAAIECTPVFEI